MNYTWLSMLYAALLCSAMWLNRKDLRMLGLSLTIGAGVFVPIPAETATLWYFQCVLVELLVMMAALQLRADASWAVALFGALLSLMHITGAYVGPQPNVGPYRVIVPILELAQFLSCLFMSAPALHQVNRLSGLAQERTK